MPGFFADEYQAGKDAVEMADDLILEHGAHLDFAQANAVQLLQLQVDAAWRIVGGALATAEQVADRSDIDRVGLLALHHLLVAVLHHGVAVQQRDRLATLQELPGEILKGVAGGFHPDQHQLRVDACNRYVNGLAPRPAAGAGQLRKTTLKDVDIKRWRHNLAQRIMDHTCPAPDGAGVTT